MTTAPIAATGSPYDAPYYLSSHLRVPRRPLVPLPHGPTERHGPMFAGERVSPADADLVHQHAGEPVGERIIVTGRLLGGDGRPLAGQLVEVWQANAAGRYRHDGDRHDAPLDPNFTGAGRCLTDAEGRYRFVTIKPGAYPWANHANGWRPAHIHFSVFGRAFTERLTTQMYFPGDPLMAHDPVVQAVRDERARQRMVASFELDLTEEMWALGYRYDVVVGGHLATPTEADT
jgi:protocatechuate 3,4-dioxygenase beta subunit